MKLFFENLKCLSIIILSFNCIHLVGQGNAKYSFDTCSFSDVLGNYSDASTIFPPSCDCGLIADGLYFDGNDDHLNFPAEMDSLMEQDFTLSLYFQFDQATTRTDILSIRGDCELDSFLAVTYNPLDETILFEFAQNISNIKSEKFTLNTSLCWHRMVITKSELFYNFYLDDKLGMSILSNGVVNFAKAAKLSIANSPCLALNEERFNGWIDQVEFYDRALSGIEIVNNSLRPDQITSNDTTIVSGSDVMINVGATCATSFTWSPQTNLDDPSILNPIASPDITTIYRLSIQNSGNCQTMDSIVINVIDPNLVDCENLLLPNAFTPNNDQLNDRFGISNNFLVESMEYFEIYDRWGAKMWNTSKISDTWDGSFKGNAVNPGMYIYKVKYTCGNQEYVKVDNFSVLR